MEKQAMPVMGKITGIRGVTSIRNSYSENKNHKVIHFEKGSVLTSYESIVVVRKGAEIYLGNDHDYSMSTKMYRNNFLGVDAKEFNKNYENGVYKLINI